MQKILEIQGESYQNHFDNLRDKICEKVDIDFQDNILLSDFIQQNNLDEDIAISNITQEKLGVLMHHLWVIDALCDVGLSIYDDLTVMDKIIKHNRLNDTHLKELVSLAVYEDCSLSSACKRMGQHLAENVENFLTFEPEVWNWTDDVEGVI